MNHAGIREKKSVAARESRPSCASRALETCERNFELHPQPTTSASLLATVRAAAPIASSDFAEKHSTRFDNEWTGKRSATTATTTTTTTTTSFLLSTLQHLQCRDKRDGHEKTTVVWDLLSHSQKTNQHLASWDTRNETDINFTFSRPRPFNFTFYKDNASHHNAAIWDRINMQFDSTTGFQFVPQFAFEVTPRCQRVQLNVNESN